MATSKRRFFTLRGAAVAALLAVILLIGLGLAAKKWAPLIGKTPFRSLATHLGERKINDAAAPFAPAEDWPAWRGPRGDGISRETGIAESWPADGLKELWSADVGLGYASPVAADGRLYLFSLDEKRDTLTCFDAATGHILWNDKSDAGYTGDFPGTRATPAIDGNVIYTFGGEGELTRHDLKTGNPVWRVNVMSMTGAQPLGYGCASSPLVVNGRVYIQGGHGDSGGVPIALAIDQETGSIAWQSEARGSGSYSHPIPIDVPDGAGGTRPQLVVFAAGALYGMDPASGKTLWKWPWPTPHGINSSTPIYSPGDGRLFITSDYGMGCALLQLSPAAVASAWQNKEIKSKFQQTILDAGFLYGNSEGRLKCLNWADGTRKWEATAANVEIGEHGSIVRVADKLVVMSDTGTLSLLRATPEGFSVLATSKVFDATEIWATPLLYGGRIYVRGTKELICLGLR